MKVTVPKPSRVPGDVTRTQTIGGASKLLLSAAPVAWRAGATLAIATPDPITLAGLAAGAVAIALIALTATRSRAGRLAKAFLLDDRGVPLKELVFDVQCRMTLSEAQRRLPGRGMAGDAEAAWAGYRLKAIAADGRHLILVFRGQMPPDQSEYARFLMASVRDRSGGGARVRGDDPRHRAPAEEIAREREALEARSRDLEGQKAEADRLAGDLQDWQSRIEAKEEELKTRESLLRPIERDGVAAAKDAADRLRTVEAREAALAASESSFREREARAAAREAHLKEAEAALASRKADIDNASRGLGAQQGKLEGERTALGAQASALREKLDEADARGARLAERLVEANQERDALRRERELAKNQSGEIGKRSEDLDRRAQDLERQSSALAAEQHDWDSRRTQFEAREKAIAAREDEARKLVEAQVDRGNKLAARERALAERQEELDKRDADIGVQYATNEARAQAAETISAEIAADRTALEEHRFELEERAKELEANTKAFQKRSQDIVRREEMIRARGTELDEREKILDARSEAVDAMSRQLDADREEFERRRGEGSGGRADDGRGRGKQLREVEAQ